MQFYDKKEKYLMRSEDEIIKQWNGRTDPLVSVICPAYNHEKYIHQAIESFLIQETDFPFEVILHDDASTDSTARIVNECKNKYPKIIQAILQEENQYSKGFKISPILLPYTKGKYIAFCEGDDYWTDTKKLQKQVKILDNNPELVICGHWCSNIDEKGSFLTKQSLTGEHCPEFFNIENALTGTPIHPNSWMYRRINWKDHKHYDLLTALPVGDDPMMLMLLSQGTGYCMKEYCSAYRLHAGGSWSSMAEYKKSLAVLQCNVGSLFFIPKRLFFKQLLNILSSTITTLIHLLYSSFIQCSFLPFIDIGRVISNQKILNWYFIGILICMGVCVFPIWLVWKLIRFTLKLF